jgi:hypothetical protein
MSSLSRTFIRRAARDQGKMGHSPEPHKTRNSTYFLKAKARRRRASKIARLARRVQR